MTVLDTPRLILRRPDPADWPAYRAYRLSPRSRPAMDEGNAWTHFAAFFGHWDLRGFGRFIAQARDDGRAVGHFGPFFPAGHPAPELTWTLWSDEGRGLAFEAAQAVRAHAFGTLGWTTAISLIAPDNARSRRLAERLGCRHAGDHDGAEVWVHRPVARGTVAPRGNTPAIHLPDAGKTPGLGV